MKFFQSCCPVQLDVYQQKHHTVNARAPQTMTEAPIPMAYAAATSPILSQVDEEEAKQELSKVQLIDEEEVKQEVTAILSCVDK